jgi:Protein of unknown function (DUF2867)
MGVVACEVPTLSVLDRRLIEDAFFHDAYRAPLSHARASPVDVFLAVFGHHPRWMKVTLVLRNWLASCLGLEVSTTAEIMRPKIKARYKVGEKIGPWPIFHLSETELVAGRDNKHLDFRLSVLKEASGGSFSAVVSTVCTTHNAFGKVYLHLIIPFHKWGVQRLMSRALTQGRL